MSRTNPHRTTPGRVPKSLNADYVQADHIVEGFDLLKNADHQRNSSTALYSVTGTSVTLGNDGTTDLIAISGLANAQQDIHYAKLFHLGQGQYKIQLAGKFNTTGGSMVVTIRTDRFWKNTVGTHSNGSFAGYVMDINTPVFHPMKANGNGTIDTAALATADANYFAYMELLFICL